MTNNEIAKNVKKAYKRAINSLVIDSDVSYTKVVEVLGGCLGKAPNDINFDIGVVAYENN